MQPTEDRGINMNEKKSFHQCLVLSRTVGNAYFICLSRIHEYQ